MIPCEQVHSHSAKKTQSLAEPDYGVWLVESS